MDIQILLTHCSGKNKQMNIGFKHHTANRKSQCSFYTSQITYCFTPCLPCINSVTAWMNLDSMLLATVMTNKSYLTPSV